MSDETKRPIAARLADLSLDAAALGGMAAITHGVDLVSRPAAFIVGGMLALAGCWLIARQGGG